MTALDTAAIDAVPVALADRDQWVCWREEDRDGKPTKVPINPHTGAYASTTDGETWGTLEDAVERIDVDGIGFVFDEGDDFVGVDLDDCRDPDSGEPSDVARDIVARLDSYTEVSPSGTGYHVLLEGELPPGGNRSGPVEMYDSSRFFTVTGAHVDGTPEVVARRQDALAEIHREYVLKDDGDEDAVGDHDGGRTVSLSDEALLERACSAANGAKFERLWQGSTTGYESHSEADMALCCLLAFWTGGDDDRMDRLFRESGLMRDKWDEVHYSDGATYGEKTVERAIERTSEYYDPSSSVEDTTRGTSETGRATQRRHSVRRPPRSDQLEDRVHAIETTVEHLESAVASLEEDVQAIQAATRDATGGQKGDTSGQSTSDDPEVLAWHRLRPW